MQESIDVDGSVVFVAGQVVDVVRTYSFAVIVERRDFVKVVSDIADDLEEWKVLLDDKKFL